MHLNSPLFIVLFSEFFSYYGKKQESKELFRTLNFAVEGDDMEETGWILYPVCKNKTCTKIREDTILRNFPLYYQKCKQENLINVSKLNMSIIKEPNTKMQS